MTEYGKCVSSQFLERCSSHSIYLLFKLTKQLSNLCKYSYVRADVCHMCRMLQGPEETTISQELESQKSVSCPTQSQTVSSGSAASALNA